MSLFMKPIDKITFEDVDRFCAQRIRENVRVEYKRDFSGANPTKQVAKEVAAMANTQGGLILFGIDEEDKKPRLPIFGLDRNPDPEDRINRICIDAIYPPVIPEIALVPVDGQPERIVAVVRVAESDQTPHSIEGRTEVYLRANDNCVPRPATIEEIEWLQDRRRLAVENRERLLRRGFDRMNSVREDDKKPLIWIGVVPTYPSRKTLRVHTITELLRGRRRDHPFVMASRFTAMAADGIVGHLPRSVRDSFEFTAADAFGLLLHAEEPHRVIKDDDKGEHVAIGEVELVRQMWSSLSIAREVYEQDGYAGLVDFRVGISRARGLALYNDSESAIERGIAGVARYDDEVRCARTIALTEHDIETAVLGLYLELRRALGVEPSPDEEQRMHWTLDQAQWRKYGKELCPCGKYIKSKARSKCVECESASS